MSDTGSVRPAFIFDWSGTLCNNLPAYVWVCGKVFTELGGNPPTAEEIRQHFTLPFMKFYNHFFPSLTREEVDPIYFKYAPQQQKCGLYEGVLDTLRSLHASGCPLFVVSSDMKATLYDDVERTGLSSLFTKVYSDVYNKDEVLREIVADYALDSQKTYYMGDTSGDVEAGRGAGVRTIGISWGYQSEELLKQSSPDYLISDMAQLPSLNLV